jgi:putative ABC transport system ATP-binding protein
MYNLNGHDVSKMTDDELAGIRNVEIGFVFQQFNLLPSLSAAENFG